MAVYTDLQGFPIRKTGAKGRVQVCMDMTTWGVIAIFNATGDLYYQFTILDFNGLHYLTNRVYKGTRKIRILENVASSMLY